MGTNLKENVGLWFPLPSYPLPPSVGVAAV
jgi:hypothetical protein